MNTPAKADGTDPMQSHLTSFRFTVPRRKWTTEPTGFITALATRSLDTAASGGTPKNSTSIGVIRAPPPIPVRPTTMPTPKAPTSKATSIAPNCDTGHLLAPDPDDRLPKWREFGYVQSPTCAMWRKLPGGAMNDAVLAAQLATEAGALLRRAQRAAAPHELGTRALKDRGDLESQAYLASALAQHRPEDLVLSEEATDSSARTSAERVWIIDPLDGTREFSEGRDDWAVHVALWSGGGRSVGAVALAGLEVR